MTVYPPVDAIKEGSDLEDLHGDSWEATDQKYGGYCRDYKNSRTGETRTLCRIEAPSTYQNAVGRYKPKGW